MFGSNPFGECPESVPVNFELICFDTDQLIRDMSMFLNFVLKLDIYDLRTQLKENVYGDMGILYKSTTILSIIIKFHFILLNT